MFYVLLYLLVLIALVFLGIRRYFKHTTWNRSYVTLAGKTAVVTGANTGIGYYTALDLAMRGARVILACRNREKGEEARNKIIAATKNENVVLKLVNYSSLKSVREFCEDYNATEERLDILVNNAGAGGLGNHVTDDGLQLMWQTNHLSAFLLTHLLIGKLKKSAPSRIVNVASVLACFGKLTAEDVNKYPNPDNVSESDGKLYNVTKQANILFTRELADRLQGSGVTVNVLHPGAIATDIWRRLVRNYKKIAYFVMNLLLKNPEEGAQTSIYCAVSKDLDNVTGKLFEECKEIVFYKSCRDMKLAKEVWKKCEEYVQMKEDEKIV